MSHAVPILGNPDTPAIPWLEWNSVRSYINKVWDPENCPHHSVIGTTGSGKSHLVIKGILPLLQHDRVLIIDSKRGKDKLVSSVGKPVTELPRRTWYSGMGRRRDEPQVNWFRLVVHHGAQNREAARSQVRSTLARVYSEGNWVVVIDEIHHITGPLGPNSSTLGLGSWVDEIYRMGRTQGVSLVASTQSPRYVPSSFYDQASFAWIGRIRDEDKQKRLLEIGGLSKKELPYIASLQRRQWLLSADNGEYFARTQVT